LLAKAESTGNLPAAAKTVYSDATSTLAQSASTEPLPWYEEVRQLREINQEQYRMIRWLEEQSLLWESVAEARADLIRNLRAALGLDPDADEEGSSCEWRQSIRHVKHRAGAPFLLSRECRRLCFENLRTYSSRLIEGWSIDLLSGRSRGVSAIRASDCWSLLITPCLMRSDQRRGGGRRAARIP
jgi:hypothetical protein